MAKRPKPEMPLEMPKEVTELAQKSVDQAQAAVERAEAFAHDNLQVFDAATSALKARTADFQLKVMEMAQGNLDASFDFARRALSVSEPAEFFALQQEFVTKRIEQLSRQSKELGELSMLFAKETAKPFQDGWVKSFGDFGRSFSG
ncbi:MAG: TIGR01841 family phasin [Rhizobiales bacterium]|nr:TIGR01841 family phasin [Hyphomicrobiales bacterium]